MRKPSDQVPRSVTMSIGVNLNPAFGENFDWPDE
jgi:hypothetical protein